MSTAMDTRGKRHGGRPKGLGRVPGSGRKVGTSNKGIMAVREMVKQALETVGGVQYLMDRAYDQPVAFMALIGRLIPVMLTGDASAPVIAKIELVAVQPEPREADVVIEGQVVGSHASKPRLVS